MKRLIALAFAVLLVLPTVALAQDYYQLIRFDWWNPQAFAQWLFPGMPDEWLGIPNVIYYVILPFFTAWVVLYGLLIELRIFRGQDKINAVIAFCLSFLLLPSGILTSVVGLLYAFGAFVGVVGFGILLIAGTILWVWGSGRRMRYEFHAEADVWRDLRNELVELNGSIRRTEEEIAREIGGAHREDVLGGLENRLRGMQERRRAAEERLRELRHRF